MIQSSFSSIKTFQTCPLQYKHKYILKDVTDPGNEASWYGTAVHEAIENFLVNGAPIPEAYSKFSKMVEPVMLWPGDAYVEHKMAVGSDFKPCEFRDANYFVRGIADYMKVDGKKARILDWKTGATAKYADIKQLELMALLLFRHFPKVDTVTAGLVFLVADKVIKATFHKKDSKSMWLRWMYEISRIEAAYNRDTFGPNPNNLCKKFCSVLTCEHNGRLL